MKKIILLSFLLISLVGCMNITQQQTVTLGNQSSVPETKTATVYETKEESKENKVPEVELEYKVKMSKEPEPPIPTASNIITLSRESVITYAGNKEVVKVSAFNPTSTLWDNKKPAINCEGLSISASANQKTIAQGEFTTFNLLLTIPLSSSNTYICEVSMEGYKKDLTIKINGE